MNPISQIRLAVSVVVFLVLTAQTSSAQSAKEECSLAVVSRLMKSAQWVCDGKAVQEMARRGHAFEQNQLGIASVMAIGPDYDEKKALKWFEQSAQRGF